MFKIFLFLLFNRILNAESKIISFLIIVFFQLLSFLVLLLNAFIQQHEFKPWRFSSRDHLWSMIGFICGRDSFAVYFRDHLRLGIIWRSNVFNAMSWRLVPEDWGTCSEKYFRSESWLDVKLKHLRFYSCFPLCCSGQTNGITQICVWNSVFVA